MWPYLAVLVISVIINEALVELISKSVFFFKLRDFLDDNKIKVLAFFGDAFKCPYCTSVWTSLFNTVLFFSFLNPCFFGELFSINKVSCFILDSFIFFMITHRCSNHFHDICDKYFNKSYSK